MTFPFDNTYARLPERFYTRVPPTPVRDPQVIAVNRPLAALLGLDADLLASPEGARVLAGNLVPAGAEPIALAYAGHQFGHFAGQLGDGRAILLGELVGADGRRRDIQLKGSGRTPYSRGGDGRAALGPVLREYIVSEAMHALGVPTTRTLAAVTTGEPVRRETLLPGAVLTRVAASHLRVGTFEYLAMRRDEEGIRLLTAYALRRHYPDARGAPGGEALALLAQVVGAQAELVARWLGLGFVHGVMNTDNTAISGETIDYGPCAFLDEYHPGKTFSSIDHQGRYAFANQPRIALWNLTRLAETLLPAIDPDRDRAVALASEQLEAFSGRFSAAHETILRAKLGLAGSEPADLELLADLFERMTADEVDHTLFFRRLCAAAEDPSHDPNLAALFIKDPDAYAPWAAAWRARLQRDPTSPADRAAAMRRVNPAFIPRNHRIEQIIAAAVTAGDYAPFETFNKILARPYDDQPEHADWAAPPLPEQRVCETFCGT
ncbi:MAG: YdiU family protein [Myxococcales bacterium]|nr:YdiU family protein [Myxococcales bacterium]